MLSSPSFSRCRPARRRAALPGGALELVARRFAVLAEPMRLRLIQALSDGEKNVSALVRETGGTQANISRHLQTLTQEHVLSRRKAGLQVYYAIADRGVLRLCEQVCGRLEHETARQATALLRPGA